MTGSPATPPTDEFARRVGGSCPARRTECCGQPLKGLCGYVRRKKDILMSRGNTSWISEWNPEDETFWKSKGKFIARRNLIWSIFAEHLGFSIWLIWSIVATKLPQAGFHYTTDELF